MLSLTRTVRRDITEIRALSESARLGMTNDTRKIGKALFPPHR